MDHLQVWRYDNRMLKGLLDMLEINILNIEHYRVHTEWQHKNVSSPYCRLYYITDGYGHIYFRNQRKKYVLKKGNIYLIPSFTLVDLYCSKSFSHYYIHFTVHTQNGFDLFSILKYTYEENAKSNNMGKCYFDRLYKLNPHKELTERNANEPIYKSMLGRALAFDSKKSIADTVESNAIIRILLTPFFRTNQTDEVSNTIKGINRFEPVIKYIQQNIASELSLTLLADVAGLHPTYLSNQFTKLMGISLIKYINRVRVEKAQVVLLTSHDNLEHIARGVGFEDVFYFSRLFKNFVGISPMKFRKQII